MIHIFLVDLNNAGELYRLSIQTEDVKKTAETLLEYSKDVRYIGNKEEAGRKDIGVRKLPDGSTIVRCQFFGDKIGYVNRFAANETRMNIINKAVDARELIANGFSEAAH